MSIVLASPTIQDRDVGVTMAAGALLAYTLLRTLRPLRQTGGRSELLLVMAEASGAVLLLAATEYWESPFAFSLLSSVAVAGFAGGFGFGLRIAVACSAAVSLPWILAKPDIAERPRTSVQWAAEVLLVALVAGYARRISGEADVRQSQALDRLGRLSDANALLFRLHQVTQTLPASLDLQEVLDATMGQVVDLFDGDGITLLLIDETEGQWEVVRKEGGRPPAKLRTEDLPAPLARAVRLHGLVSEQNLIASGGPGLSGSAGSGLYATLLARGSVIGLLAIEHGEPHHFAARDVELLSGFVDSAALAIDNARWFGRLRTVGADEERTRIARDLHDRIGQSLAYLAFELDRIVKTDAKGETVAKALDQLRGDVRGVIGEVRDTLYDLRTDVTDAQSLPATLEAFLARVAERSALQVSIRAQETGRLPILQERELWRIAQEAITNVERHAKATQVSITWRCDGGTAALEVADDGIGFPVGKAGRLDSYGLLGMRERAASIGATLAVESEPGKGTRVRCALGTR